MKNIWGAFHERRQGRNCDQISVEGVWIIFRDRREGMNCDLISVNCDFETSFAWSSHGSLSQILIQTLKKENLVFQ